MSQMVSLQVTSHSAAKQGAFSSANASGQLVLLTIKIPARPIPPTAQGSLAPTSVPNRTSTSLHVVQPEPSASSKRIKTALLSITNHGQPTSLPRMKTGRIPSTHAIPKARLLIPDISIQNSDGTRRSKKESWKDIVKHWLTGDPEHGLHTPLKDWPQEWIQGGNRLFAVKYHQRSVIALEFINT